MSEINTGDGEIGGGEGTPKTSWLDGVSDELRTNPTLQKYDSQEAALKALVNAQELIGRKGLVAPSEDADQATLNTYRAARRGGIQSPAGYKEPAQFTAEQLAEIGLTSEALSGMRQTAFDIGLDSDGYRAFVGRAVQNIKAQSERNAAAFQAQTEALATKLKGEWGDTYETRIAEHQALMEGAGILEAVQMSGLGQNEAFVRFLDEAVKTVKGEGTLPQIPSGGSNPLEEARAVAKSGAASDFRNPARMQGAMENYSRAITRMAQRGRKNGNFIEV